MKPQPLVSICIPTFNGEKYIRETLDSVMNQTYENLEIRISDHSSSDRTLEIVRELADARVQLHLQPSGGGAEENWNASIAGAKGKYLKVVCQDDLLHSRCIEYQVRAMQQHPYSSFCFSSRDVISPKGRTLIPARGFKPKDEIVAIQEYLPTLVRSGTNLFGEPCSVLIDGEALSKAGPFSGSYLIDLNMWYSLWKIGPAVYVPMTAAKFRISEGSWTTSLLGQQSDQMAAKLNEWFSEWPELVTQDDVKKGIKKARKFEEYRNRLTRLVEFIHI